ncbi:MAG: hypothetical protein WC229_03710 [Candidatus Paceibacterota bacterium]|jgi:hypothetical protein
MTKIIKRQIKNLEYREKSIIWSLFSVFVLLLVSYGFLVSSSMANAVKRQDLSKQNVLLNSEINSMEFVYLEAKNSITMELALREGFVVDNNEKFVSIAPASSNLSLSINEN